MWALLEALLAMRLLFVGVREAGMAKMSTREESQDRA